MRQRGPDPCEPIWPEAEAYRQAGGSLGPASNLAAAREKILAITPGQMDSAALRETWSELHEFWLTTKAAQIGITAGSGFAIVATGSLGRRDLLPYSDLDLLLVHDEMPADIVQQIADQLWYPLWDANIRLDHSVRTVAETLRVAGADVSAGLATLDARHMAGDEQLSARLVEGVRWQWRTGIQALFGELVEQTHARWRRSGEIAHRAEPDLKLGRGGLRDVQLLDALAIAQLADRRTVHGPDNPMGSLTDAHLALLNVRTELHRVSGRGHDLLLAQYADEISAALHIGDRYILSRKLSDAGRTISYWVDAGLRIAANALPRRGMSAMRWRPRRPLDEGVVEFAGEIVLARSGLGGARRRSDPALVLRVAAASAVTGLPIAASTLHSASVNIHEGVAISEFVVSPRFGSPPAAELMRQQFIGALDGAADTLDVLGILEQRDSDAQLMPVGGMPTAVPVHDSTAPPRILWFDGTPGRLIIEVRVTDRTGLLALLTGALEHAGADIIWAKVTTVGSMVDDVFCVALPARGASAKSAGEPGSGVRATIEQHLLAVLDAARDVAVVEFGSD
jgi:UTP:GlnB (protein PII) uridylyltransferase